MHMVAYDIHAHMCNILRTKKTHTQTYAQIHTCTHTQDQGILRTDSDSNTGVSRCQDDISRVIQCRPGSFTRPNEDPGARCLARNLSCHGLLCACEPCMHGDKVIVAPIDALNSRVGEPCKKMHTCLSQEYGVPLALAVVDRIQTAGSLNVTWTFQSARHFPPISNSSTPTMHADVRTAVVSSALPHHYVIDLQYRPLGPAFLRVFVDSGEVRACVIVCLYMYVMSSLFCARACVRVCVCVCVCVWILYVYTDDWMHAAVKLAILDTYMHGHISAHAHLFLCVH